MLGLVNELEDVFFWNAQTGWAVGQYGTILHTNDGGVTWQRQVSPFTTDQPRFLLKNLYRVVFVDAQTGWIVGADWLGEGVLLHTDDGGLTWVEQSLYFSADENVGMTWADARAGWLMLGRRILHTTDGGRTWLEQSLPESLPEPFSSDRYWLLASPPLSITCVDAQHAWIAIDNIILRTVDGGQTWTTHYIASDFHTTSFTFVDTMTGWATSYGIIAQTTDGGRTWQTQYKSDTGMGYVVFVDAHIGWATSGLGQIWHTKDGGATWEKHGEAPRGRQSITFVDAQHGWAVSRWGNKERPTIAYTDDGGASWQDAHIEMPALAYVSAARLIDYLAERNPPLEVLLTQLFQGPCNLWKEWEWMEIALSNLGWNGTNWDDPPATPDDSLARAVGRLEADLDGDGADEIVLYGEQLDELFVSVLDWDGTQWQVALPASSLASASRFPIIVSYGGKTRVRIDDFDADGQLDLLVEETLCAPVNCTRRVSLIHCSHLSCQSVWSKKLGFISGGSLNGVEHRRWSSSDYQFTDLEGDNRLEIELQEYGISHQVETDDRGLVLLGTLEAKVLTTTQTIYRWNGTQYTPTVTTVLEPGYMLDVRPVTETVDLDGDGVLEQAVFRWESGYWEGLRQMLTIYTRDDLEGWQPTQTFTATIVAPSTGISLQDLNGNGMLELVLCTRSLPLDCALDTWPSTMQPNCTFYDWDTDIHTFVLQSDER